MWTSCLTEELLILRARVSADVVITMSKNQIDRNRVYKFAAQYRRQGVLFPA